MRTLIAGMLLLAAAPAAAQDGWDFAVTPYVWLPSLTNKLHTDTRFGTIESSTSGDDVLSNLDMAFMAAFEARHGRWGLIADLLYTDLSSESDTPAGLVFDSVKTEIKGTALSGYALYRVVEQPQVALDVGGGFRAYWLSFDTTLEPGLARIRPREFDLSENWVDPLLAVRGIVTFSDRWSANAVLDYGGFDGENDSTWQALASVNYAIGDRWTIRGGWRYLDIQKEIDGFDIESELNGPIIGVGFHF
jgi:opacity protein-like surface antigen